ncbi:MAG: alpha-2-macroglobulin family protein [Bacteroidota bacterium]
MKAKFFLMIVMVVLIAVTTGAVIINQYSTVYNPDKLVFVKGSSYSEIWKKVEEFEKKGLPQSALEIVESIYTQAKLDKNYEQIIKEIIYKQKYKVMLEEDAYQKIVLELKAEIDSSEFPLTPILNSMLADVYWSFYTVNRWQFYNRSETVGFNPEDMNTWDLKRIINACTNQHKLALMNADSLKLTNIDFYDDILVVQPTTRSFRPTLYDFIAHRAVDFFTNSENELTKPANSFKIDKEEYFMPYDEFIKLEIDSSDSLSLKYNALLLLQKLVEFHSADSQPDALIDADLKRLNIVYNNSIHPEKDTLFINALRNLEVKFVKFPVSADVSHKIAVFYETQGYKYQPLNSDDYKWQLKKSHEYAAKIIKRHPDSFGAINCKALQSRIEYQNLTFNVESFNLPNKEFRSFITYKNTEKIYFRIIKIDWKKQRNEIYEKYGEDLIKYFLKLKPVNEFSEKVKIDGDYQTHTTEIKFPQLELGHYLIIASTNKEFSNDSNTIAYGYTQITNIGYNERKDKMNAYDVYVFDRETGNPLEGVETILWMEKYDYVLQRYKLSKYKTFSSDKDGYVHVSATSEYGVSYYIEFVNKEDRLFTNNSFYQYNYYSYDPPEKLTYFFTDREIYRPGQTIYFKGIMLSRNGENHKILPGFSTIVYFYDVNYQVIAQTTLTTNEYGTFSGTFTAPQGVLTGQMHINDYYGSKYFSVEEYKRPQFEVNFKKVEGSYKLDQTVNVAGNAKSYAGANIDGADVKYEVKRTAYFPYRWSWWYWWYPTSDETVVTYGTTKTDENGDFKIEFLASPDLSISRKWKPSFTYSVTADVTDINGETHSSSQYVNVGYSALLLSTDWEENVNKSTCKNIEIISNNLNGEFITAEGTITIYKIKENQKLFRKRLWSEPDVKQINKDEYYNLFPNDLYADEDNITKLKKDSKVYEKAFKTEKSKKISIPEIAKWEQGKYLIEVKSKDEFGEDVNYEQYVTIFSPAEFEVAVNDIAWFSKINNNCEPGETASYIVGSAEKDVKVLFEIEHKDKIVKKEWITLDNSQKLIEIPIEEKHRGNLAVHFVFVKHGRSYEYNDLITVPYSNKELDIKFETFRDKLNPGQQEEWRIKIKGPNGEKVAAEMLATLYDASLDAFKANNWYFDIYQTYYNTLNWYSSGAYASNTSVVLINNYANYSYEQYRQYDKLNWFGFYYSPYYYSDYNSFGGYGYYDGDLMMDACEVKSEHSMRGADYEDSKKDGFAREAAAPPAMAYNAQTVAKSSDVSGLKEMNIPMGGSSGESNERILAPVEIRKNFSETAFFFPELETNEEGEVVVKFTVPESLTKWKMMGFAHTKDLKFGFIDNELVTQKELMIIPNVPRFIRENDEITFSAKITNLSKTDLSGKAQMKLFDALTMKPVEVQFKMKSPEQTFNVKAGQSTVVFWHLKVPEGVQAVTYRFTAQTAKFSDGEENTIPVLTNRMLVTESMPLPIRSNQTKTFKFEKLLKSNSSSTLQHHKLTLEFTANPAWYAVQALPYLIEYPYECAEQIFSRYYSNSIASHIANSSPKIKAVFDSWKNTPESKALLSNLEKNQELKSLLLEETPWVLDAQDESQRKRRVGLLFDLNHMANNIGSAFKKLEKLQCSNGGFVWFKGGPDDRYITQHIVTGFGHLDNLGVKDIRSDYKVWNMVSRGVNYLDNEIRKDYNWIKKYYTKEEMEEDHISYYQIQYLYARSYFNDIPIQSSSKEAFDYFKGQAAEYWLEKGNYMQGMIALGLNRFGDEKTPPAIMKSLKEHALISEEMGMYWKENSGGYYWYQAPIETHSLLIEAFDEVAKDGKAVDDLKVWLLKQKQTQDWKTTKATTEAVYALLIRGTDWLATESGVEIFVADMKIDPKNMPDVKVEAGTGYFKTSWSGNEIKPEMGEVKVLKKDEGVSWGAMYWQYFEQLDKITPHETPLKLYKQLFKQEQAASGKVIKPIDDNSKLKVGDKVIVRIELKVDRRMEYVHMKDMRAACFEPLNVISQYKYQDGLGYYESTRDVSTNFFFSNLNKGTYVFEYPLWVTHEGDFSNGITTIQCMYAPEFTSHSEGIRVNVEGK